MSDTYGLLSAPIPGVLRQMAIPMTFGMIAVLTFNVIDTFFVSLLGTDALAAISFTFPVTFGLNCITMGIGIGLSTHIGHLLGKGNTTDAATLTSHGLLLALLLVTLCALLGFHFMTPIFNLLHASPDLQPQIHQYMSVWFLAVPLLSISMAASSAIRTTGDTKTPAIIMTLSGLINGGLDPLLIFGIGPFPKLGIQGAAIASAMSWLVALFLTFYILSRKDKLLAMPKLTGMIKNWASILEVGTPAAFANAMNPLAAAILMVLFSHYGKQAIAAYGAAQRVEAILIIVLMSLTSSLTPFMAQNFGADKHQRSFTALFLCMRFSIIFQFVVFIMMVPLSIPIAALFSQEEGVQHLLWSYLIIVPASYGFQGMVMILISSLNALRTPIIAFGWSITRLFLLILPCAFLGTQVFGIKGSFIGIAIGNVIGGTLAYMHAIRLRKRCNA